LHQKHLVKSRGKYLRTLKFGPPNFFGIAKMYLLQDSEAWQLAAIVTVAVVVTKPIARHLALP
jgi:hypothetical protein